MDTKDQFLEMVAMSDDPVDALANECVRLLQENEKLAKDVEDARQYNDRLRSLLLGIKRELMCVY